MTVHIDVLFTQKMSEIIKHDVYYTVIYCDQNMEDTVCIILKTFSKK